MDMADVVLTVFEGSRSTLGRRDLRRLYASRLYE